MILNDVKQFGLMLMRKDQFDNKYYDLKMGLVNLCPKGTR